MWEGEGGAGCVRERWNGNLLVLKGACEYGLWKMRA
jgi:hypothetical protein